MGYNGIISVTFDSGYPESVRGVTAHSRYDTKILKNCWDLLGTMV